MKSNQTAFAREILSEHSMNQNEIQVVCHPAERKKRLAVPLLCGCCCCCCCCLHSLGGVVGALTTPSIIKGQPLSVQRGSFLDIRPRYWLTLILLNVLPFIGFVGGILHAEDIWLSTFIVVMGLPAMQLLASWIVWMSTFRFSEPQRSLAAKQIASLTKRTLLGTLIGAILLGLGIAGFIH